MKDEHERLKLRYNDEQLRKHKLESALQQDKLLILELQDKLQATQQVERFYFYLLHDQAKHTSDRRTDGQSRVRFLPERKANKSLCIHLLRTSRNPSKKAATLKRSSSGSLTKKND